MSDQIPAGEVTTGTQVEAPAVQVGTSDFENRFSAIENRIKEIADLLSATATPQATPAPDVEDDAEGAEAPAAVTSTATPEGVRIAGKDELKRAKTELSRVIQESIKRKETIATLSTERDEKATLSAQLQAERDKLAAQLQDERVNRIIERKASGRFIDTEVVLKLIDKNPIKVEGDNVIGVEEALDKLATEKPFLVKKDAMPNIHSEAAQTPKPLDSGDKELGRRFSALKG